MITSRFLISIPILALLLVTAVPVDAAPLLQTGARSTYDVSSAISFVETCDTVGPVISSAILCPGIAAFPTTTNVNGTIGWTVSDLTSSIASLNVTHDLTIASPDSTRPVIQSAGSINESINLATRQVNLFSSIMPEMDQLLLAAQSTAATSAPGANLGSSIATIESLMPLHPFYTMWWVNGPLDLNETVPVLVLPTNVTESSRVDLGGSIGSRDAWTLSFSFSRAIPDPLSPASPSSPVSDLVAVSFEFNYDKTSDILLNATATIHTGFESEMTIPSPSCTPSASMTCPAGSSSRTIMTSFGVNIESSLKLSSTTVDLTHRMTQAPPPQNNGGTQTRGGAGNGSNGSGSSDATNSASSSPNNNGATGSTDQPSGNSNQTASRTTVSGWPLWLGALLVFLAAGVITSAVLISRRRSNARRIDTSNQASK